MGRQGRDQQGGGGGGVPGGGPVRRQPCERSGGGGRGRHGCAAVNEAAPAVESFAAGNAAQIYTFIRSVSTSITGSCPVTYILYLQYLKSIVQYNVADPLLQHCHIEKRKKLRPFLCTKSAWQIN
jgi:hypothetical protein